MDPIAQEAGYDVVVVGGGAAGLSTALALSRARRRVLVVDAGAPRNALAAHVHNYLGRESASPAALLADGRAEVEQYGGEVRNGAVERVEPQAGPAPSFRVGLADGTQVRARRLVVATGLVDEMPAVEGLAARWGRDVLHCPYCHGWEVRDAPIGVLSTGPFAVDAALLWRQWSDDVVLLQHTGPAPTEEQHERLAARGIAVATGEVTAVEVDRDGLTGVRLRSGETVPRRALVVLPTFRPRPLPGLPLQLTEQVVEGVVLGSRYASEHGGTTQVPGVHVVGNATDPFATVIGAAAGGTVVAGALNRDLVREDADLAVARMRQGANAA